jgi:dienelactone hydrolase
MRRALTTVVAVVVGAVVVAACVPPPPPAPPAPYLDAAFPATVTPKAQPVTWGAAPPIDEHYGGTLYEGTDIETADPRPPLDAQGNEPLRLWAAEPTNTQIYRPAIVWLHGGGFAVGIDGMYGLANGVAKEYAERGYVGFSVEYRIDTTLIGSAPPGGRPPSLCQWVQDHQDPTDPVWVQRLAQCQRNILAAQEDAQAAVRWLRAHAGQYRIDPNRIAVAGFSAGAVTAADLAYHGDHVGTTSYFPGDQPSVEGSKIQAALGASGCEYDTTSIGAGDAPTSWIHSKGDRAVPYSCMADVVTAARAAGLVAELTSYCSSSLHAQALYQPNKVATDEQWTTFLARELRIYSKLRPPSTDPVCP